MKIEKKRINELKTIAESIADKYYKNSAIDPILIAKDNGIIIHKHDFGESFEGSICCNYKTKKFHIFINTSSDIEDKGRIRFTISHELGHFFIKEHNDLLRIGRKLKYHKNKYYYFLDDIYETEADIFAANLLMPNNIFIQKATYFPSGLESIIPLSNFFQTSVLSTAYKYINNNIIPSIMVRFDENNEIIERKSAFSKKMRDITNQNIVLQYNTNRPLADSKTIKLKGENEIVFTQSITNISSWARSILPSSKNDFIVVEQKLKLGSFGSIVFIFPANFMSLIGFA